MITNHLSRLSKKGKTDRNFPGFDRFKKALRGMHSGENGLGYIQTAVTRFMERFRYVWTKHMSTKWRSNELVWYIIAGEPYLAREFARWLVDYDERDAEDTEDTVDLSNEFAFADVTITLSEVHKMTRGNEKVNVCKLMTYITAEADRAEILKIAFIKRHLSQIKMLAESPTVVCLFNLLDISSGKSLYRTRAHGVIMMTSLNYQKRSSVGFSSTPIISSNARTAFK